MIKLHHFLRGPMTVMPIRGDGNREWMCPSRPMLRPMGDGEFTETREEINELLAAEEEKAAKFVDAMSEDRRDQGGFAKALLNRPW
jgi:U3 small nucleolar RNA-associated protein 14